jgi:sarcosine oxidase
VKDDDVAPVRRLLRQRLPGADTAPTRSVVCMYTNTPDGHFLIDELPDAAHVLLATACSGHGFKFASALGELVADRLTGTPPALDLEPFRLDRPAMQTKTTSGVLQTRG